MKTNQPPVKEQLTVYELDTPLPFGKFRGKSILEVFYAQPSYLVWCLANVKEFHLHRNTLATLRMLEPEFGLSKEAAVRWAENEQTLNRRKHLEPSQAHGIIAIG